MFVIENSLLIRCCKLLNQQFVRLEKAGISLILERGGNVSRIRISLSHACRTRASVTTSRTEPFFPLSFDLVIVFVIMFFQTFGAVSAITSTFIISDNTEHLVVCTSYFSLSAALNHISLSRFALMTPLRFAVQSLLFAVVNNLSLWFISHKMIYRSSSLPFFFFAAHILALILFVFLSFLHGTWISLATLFRVVFGMWAFRSGFPSIRNDSKSGGFTVAANGELGLLIAFFTGCWNV